MPTLPEILNQLQFIGYETVLLGLFATASIIIIARDWRFLILALLVQYILVGLMLSRLVRPDIAVLGILIGAFICPILFLSARQVAVLPPSISDLVGSDSNSQTKLGRWWQKAMVFLRGTNRATGVGSTGFGFRVFVGLFVLLVAVTLSESLPLSNIEPVMVTAIYWLVLAGLITLTLTEDPMKAGHGLFTALSGFGLLYTILERSLLLTGLWGTVNLLIALAIGYLTVVKGTGREEKN